eukprot:203874-Rhodomonas_salina.2
MSVPDIAQHAAAIHCVSTGHRCSYALCQYREHTQVQYRGSRSTRVGCERTVPVPAMPACMSGAASTSEASEERISEQSSPVDSTCTAMEDRSLEAQRLLMRTP